mmetsp:Transcript_33491/g.71784  ORF Transcript_33491/g.71784 Transcript_33491/m.71784 type:complete len:416 (+) Transcript_33491:448-1695(+)
METAPFILMQDRLSSRGSFILCDANATGFPIRYASAGFCDLFEFSAVECRGQKCGDLVADKALHAPDFVERIAKEVSMSVEEVNKGLKAINDHVCQECRAMMQCPTTVTGYSVVLNRTKSGALKVIDLAMMVCRHPQAGWLYTVGLQTDITESISVKTLLSAAAKGQHGALVRDQEPNMRKRVQHIGAEGPVARGYLDSKASEMWESLMLEALGVEVKALSEVSDSLISTSLSTSPSLVDDCHGRKSQGWASSEAPTQSEFDSFPCSWAGRQVSGDSSFIPDFEWQAFSRHGTDESNLENVRAYSRPMSSFEQDIADLTLQEGPEMVGNGAAEEKEAKQAEEEGAKSAAAVAAAAAVANAAAAAAANAAAVAANAATNGAKKQSSTGHTDSALCTRLSVAAGCLLLVAAAVRLSR